MNSLRRRHFLDFFVHTLQLEDKSPRLSDDWHTMKPTPPDKPDAAEASRTDAAPTRSDASDTKDKKGLSTRLRSARRSIDETRRTWVEKAEQEREKHESVRTLFHLYDEDKGRGGGLLAGGLAYRLFIWLLPAALVASSILRLFADSGSQSPSAMAKDVGMGAAMATTVDQAAAQTGRAAPILLVMGLVIMLWASRGVLKALRLVSTIAWRLSPVPFQSQVRTTLATAAVLFVLPVYSLVVAPLYGGSLGGDVVATVLATTGLAAVATWAAGRLPLPEGVRWFHLLPGAILFAFGFEALRLATTIYFAGKLDRVDDLYGALGFAAVFMTYLYLLARITVLGLMANAAVYRSNISKRTSNDLKAEGTAISTSNQGIEE